MNADERSQTQRVRFMIIGRPYIRATNIIDGTLTSIQTWSGYLRFNYKDSFVLVNDFLVF